MVSKKEQGKEAQLASHWGQKFKESMVAKAPYTKRWNTYMDAYDGNYFKNASLPDYKSDYVSNYIFSIIETIRPIMLDNDPKFQAMPRQPGGMAFATDVNEALSYEWDREQMNTKLYRELINGLVLGSYIFFTPYDKEKKEVRATPVSPFNLFPDPLASSIEDSEYLIYASYHNVVALRRMFKDRAKEITGGNINYGELVYEKNKDSNVDNQVLVLEVYSRDHETLTEDATTGEKKSAYPNGRVTTVCPDLGLVLADKANPYKDGEFPFVLAKDYDIPGKFWGEGEVAQLLSPQKYMNELNNAIIDNAKTTANAPWIIDNNAGIPVGGITARQGLVIRKNQGSEVRREQPPGMPAYVVNAVDTYKNDMEQISGIFDSLKGNSETGVYTAQGILALQEAGQARIRLKVKLMEESLGKLAKMWFSRMNQFWTEDRWIRTVQFDGSYDFKRMKVEAVKKDYDIRIMAGSTMPVNRGAMLDLMIRLAQTPMSDGQALVDREAVAQYLPSEVKSAMLSRMNGKNENVEQQFAQMQEAMAQLGQGVQQVAQQLEQVVKETQSNDEQTMGVVEELVSAIEKINTEILQVQDDNGKMVAEQQEQEKQTKLKNDSYNSGYSDAERLLSSEDSADVTADLGEDDDMGLGLPEDILAGLEELSDDELAVLLASNPEIADLLG